MRTAAWLAAGSVALCVGLVAAFGRWGMFSGALAVAVACVLAAGVAAGEERSSGSA